jgi:ubiquinone/menaquinone biosynthesis C-methylase UbiE
MNSVLIAKWLMKISERRPHFSENEVGELREAFNHDSFLQADSSHRKSIMLKSSESKYKSELQYPWDNYFGFSLKPLLHGKNALDLGCFTGGRSIAWFERYGLNRISGTDINDVYIEAAREFGSIRHATTDFRLGCGEHLPFSDNSLDAILTFDVFEHVKDIHQTLNECYRVLRKGGRLFSVFPSYFNPMEHHLSLVTNLPCIHWLFNGQTLMRAYWELLEERGNEAYWYKRSSQQLESWERCNSINGTTFLKFRAIIRTMKWEVQSEVHKQLGSVGRNVSQFPFLLVISKLLFPLTFIPVIQEAFLHRITFILKK